MSDTTGDAMDTKQAGTQRGRDMEITVPDSIVESIGRELSGFGGVLRCEVCGATTEVDAPTYTRVGWPTCHGYTMRWWTARQIAAGEMPPLIPC